MGQPCIHTYNTSKTSIHKFTEKFNQNEYVGRTKQCGVEFLWLILWTTIAYLLEI